MLGPETPCAPWITEADLCCPLGGVPPALIASSIQASTEFLYDKTCRRWPGTACTATVRPCLPCECCVSPYAYSGFGWPGNPNTAWSPNCQCRWRHFALQAPYPIQEILAFMIDGVDETPTVRLDSKREVTLLDSSARSCFPIQRLDLPDGAPGTWSIRYRFGLAPIGLAKLGAADLACELIKSCQGLDCTLPDNAESVTKRGITVRFRGPGFTNVKTADLLIDGYGCPKTGTRRMIDPAVRPHVYRGV